MSHRRWWTMTLVLGLAAACGDQLTTPVTAPITLDPSLNITPTADLDATITGMIATLYPKGLETAAGTRWENVKQKYTAGLTDPAQAAVARKLVFELARWAAEKSSQMDTPPDGETREAAAARLASYMALYIYQGPQASVPTYNPAADAVVGFVTPTGEATITTPAKRAGIAFDPGSVAENTIVTISQNPNPFPATCDGPLTTRRCQYPLFYDFHTYPVQKFLKSAHIAVCHVTPASNRRPLDAANSETVHDRLRLAHTLPADPANYTDGATQYSAPGENIEILPLSVVQDAPGIDCSFSPVTASDPLERFFGTFASAVGRLVVPASLHAVDKGPTHDVDFMSAFNSVDPVGQPDLTVGPMSAAPTSTAPGEAISTTFTVFNTSPVNGGAATAGSDAGTATFYLSSDAIITPTDVALGSVALPALVPDATQSVGPAAVVIPANTAPGSYHLGIIVTQPITEADLANNSASIPVTVQAPVSPPPLSAPAMGTTLTAGSGTPTIDGQIGTGEWNVAECGSIPVNTPQGGTTTGVVCAKNDATNVYFLYQLTRSVDDPGKSIGAEFDTNADGAIGAWDDTFVHNPALTGLTDGVRVQCGSSTCGPTDAAEGGQNHGSAAYGFHGSYAVHEVSKPLASGDGRDFSLMPGDAIGWFFDARLVNGPAFPGDYGDTRYPATGLMTLQLSGATTIPNPAISFVGTEQYTSGQLFDRYSFTVTNQASLPEALFDPMPGLPPCGVNTESSRTWVELVDQSGAVRNTFCAIGSWSELTGIWFAVSRWVQPPPGMAVRLTDRLRGTTYTQPYHIPLYGPVFNHFPRTLELNWAPMSGAVTYDAYWEYGNGCTTGDWTTCSTTWTPGGTNTGLTGLSHTIGFVGAQQGRWRVTGRDASGAPVGTTTFKYFRFTI